MLTLYDYFRSSASYRVRIALNLKGLDYQIIPIHLTNQGGEQFSATYEKINPHNLVPTLNDGKRILTQSLAIIEYLNDLHPTPPLLPTDIYEKALARSFAMAIAADIHPLNNLRVLTYLTNTLHIGDEQKKQWYQHWLYKGLTALEKQLVSQQTAGKFCFGDQATLADICLAPQLYNARRFECDLSQCPTLVSIDKHCQQHPAFQQAQPQEVTA